MPFAIEMLRIYFELLFLLNTLLLAYVIFLLIPEISSISFKHPLLRPNS